MSNYKLIHVFEVMWESHLVLQQQLPPGPLLADYELMLIRMYDLIDATDEYWVPVRAAFLAHEAIHYSTTVNVVSQAYSQVFTKLIDDLHTLEMREFGDSFWEDIRK